LRQQTFPDGRLTLGQSSIAVSPIAWGMWRFSGSDVADASRLINTVLDTGITLFDTADVYGLDYGDGFGSAEALLGRVFETEPTLRGRMVLAGKGGINPGVPYDSSKEYLIRACEASLARLKTDYLDLYQIHRPDILTHPAEIGEALSVLLQSGKIRTAGVSNYTASQTAALQAHLPFPLATHQPEFSALSIGPLYDGVLDQAIERGMAVLAWSPLAGGRLGRAGDDRRSSDVIASLDELADKFGTSRDAIAYAWIMAHPARPIPIVGSQTPDRIRAAAGALNVNLTREDWYRVLTATRQEPLP
jgi:predicted oxidoreductase